MEPYWNAIIRRQMEAALDMLEAPLRDCPADLWREPLWSTDVPGLSEFWAVAHHALFWLDLYLTGTEVGFTPPAPFGLEEMDPDGAVPERAYTREELLGYGAHCRAKLRAALDGLSPEAAQRACPFPWGTLSFAELQVDSMRHVQEHAAQLSLFLGQRSDVDRRWKSGA
jgi:hypothetical protein